MQNQKQAKLFAFQLAEKRAEQAQPAQQWKLRDGISHAVGCTYIDEDMSLQRASDRYVGTDAGIYC